MLLEPCHGVFADPIGVTDQAQRPTSAETRPCPRALDPRKLAWASLTVFSVNEHVSPRSACHAYGAVQDADPLPLPNRVRKFRILRVDDAVVENMVLL